MNLTVPAEMVTRYVAAARPLAWVVPVAALSAMLVLLGARRLGPLGQRRLHFGLLALAAAGGVWWGWRLRWLCDDAFISFRYADNLLRGHGLVFNVGERVEGYTNFLWTLLLAGTATLGLHAPQMSLLLGLLSFALLLATMSRIGMRIAPQGTWLAVPLAAGVCAAQYTMASFATSGLETMFASLLSLLALERALAGAYFAAGACGVAAAMAHPDHGILYAGLGLALLLGKDTRRGVARYALPFALFYAPYFAWRWQYYGELFPNTYYAKSGGLPYFAQGGVYLASLLIGGGLWALLPLAAYATWRLRRTLFGRYAMIAIPLFCVYVAKIGGDFMYGRLLCPIVAPLLLLAEAALADALTRRRFMLASVAAALLCVPALPVKIIQPLEKKWFLADERTFYQLTSFNPIRVHTIYFDWAEVLAKHFPTHKSAPRLFMYSAGMISYYTGWPTIDGFGLTDRMIAHRPLLVRGRPGHEKHGSAAYIASRGVDISDELVYPVPYSDVAQLWLDRVHFNLGHYDPKLLKRLRGVPGVSFTDFERHLASQLRLPVLRAASDHVACDVWFANEYYISRVPNSPYKARLEQRLLDGGRAFGAVPDATPSLSATTPRKPLPETALHFDAGERSRYEVSGDAFREFPALDARASQEWISGHRGAFVDTFDLTLGDLARGQLRSKPFKLVGDVMELWVGGGHSAKTLHVSLIVDGKAVLTTGGCGSDMMSRRLWQIAPFKGKDAVLEIVDDASGPGDYLSVDEVVQWIDR
jgi:hypothetical protein